MELMLQSRQRGAAGNADIETAGRGRASLPLGMNFRANTISFKAMFNSKKQKSEENRREAAQT